LADTEENEKDESLKIHDLPPVEDLYRSWFLDYASYVILERAVPEISDGLKPVQRRILHAMKEIDDGRFNKVANIIGSTMQFHPHGDASINDALVALGQKDLVIETQGNWGDFRTGDSAAAPRYIEARLSKFALEVAFQPKLTEWQASYDGRKKEPVALPMKFPLLLAQGVEGIAVGLSTKIMPHNFIELCDASIKVIQGKNPKLSPDFLTGGLADFNHYGDGKRGSKIKVRAKIEKREKNYLAITEIPFGTTTQNLMESIVKANDSGKIKIKQVVDNTAKEVEILVYLAGGISPEITMDALYAFTDCEVSISPNACVIRDESPAFLSVSEILKTSTENTQELLKRELEIRRDELKEKILFSSLEKIFIENRIYRNIEECETWQAVLDTIDKGLLPFEKQFYRKIVEEDLVRLTEIKIKRISKFDSFKADEIMKGLEEDLKLVEAKLKNMDETSIKYFQHIKEKYGKGRERKTVSSTFENIKAHVVAVNNVKFYLDRKEGFAGTGLKRSESEFVFECSDLDDVIVFRKDGKYLVIKVQDKAFVGKGIVHAGVFKKGDDRMVYHAIYQDGVAGKAFVKRFQVLGVTRDKEYDLTRGGKGSRMHYFSANPNGEGETVIVKLAPSAKARKKVFDFDFAGLEIKGRGAGGNTLTKYPIRKVELKERGSSTLSGIEVWMDEVTGRFNQEERGLYLGSFQGEDQVLVLFNSGQYEIMTLVLTTKLEPGKLSYVGKFDAGTPINIVHLDAEQGTIYVKRFLIETNSVNKPFSVISEAEGSKQFFAYPGKNLVVRVKYRQGNKVLEKDLSLSDLIGVKGWKANGNKFPIQKFQKIDLVSGGIEIKGLSEKASREKPNSGESPNLISKETELDIPISPGAKDESTVEPVDDRGGEEAKEKPPSKKSPKKKSKSKKEDDKKDFLTSGQSIEFDF
jgi:topoisomerase IV subunit A